MFVVTIAVGITVSLAMLELTGLVAGGVIVPAYVSLLLVKPWSLGALLAIALASFGILRLTGNYLMLYGTRRYSVSLLVGALLNAGARSLDPAQELPIEWVGLGYLIPGLIAYHFDRQGVLKTVLAIAVAAPIVRAIVVLAGYA